MIEQNLILILVLLPFIAALVAATLPVNAHSAAAWLSGLSLAGGLAIMIALYEPISGGMTLRVSQPWIPSLMLNLNFRIDGFAWLFVTLVLSIGILVVLYARYYLDKNDPVPRFYSFLMAFTGAMVGVLVSGNILMLAVFWELTSIISFLLIGYWYQNPAARDGARTALTITAGGGICLLASMLIIGQIAGSYNLDVVLASGAKIKEHWLYMPALILFLLAAFTKSAQFPFHFWLPGAMAAPTPVSSFLHSATMVKAGVFLLVRFFPVFGGTEAWFYLVTGTGMATLLIGSAIALFRHDLKGLLAYSTISNLGLITALCGIGSTGAILAAIFHIVNHALFKASLFMGAGIVDHEAGTRDMRKLSGLWKLMPFTGVLAILASAAMAGVPLLNGFISKEMFFAEAADWHNGSWLDNALPWFATLAGALTVAYSLRLVLSVFFGPQAEGLPKKPHEPIHWMRRPVEILVLLCLVIGLFPSQTVEPILNVAARSVLGAGLPETHVVIWHGFNTALQMSLIAMALGAAIYFLFAGKIAAGPEGPPLIHRIRAQRLYEIVMLRISWKYPRALHKLSGTDKLQPQLRMIFMLGLATGVLVLGAALWNVPASRTTPLNPAFAVMWVLGAACALGAAWQAKYHRFASLILLGGAGLVTCVTFAWFSAPDLAVTQLLVEVVTTVLLLLGLRWLPKRREEIIEDQTLTARARRTRDLVVAILSGAGLAGMAYFVMTRPLTPNIGDWFLRNAYYEGGGTNVVNVILVDFRAFDTFGEITVLCIVGLTVFALLRRFRPSADSAGKPEQQRIKDDIALRDYLFVPSVIMRWMYPVLILMAAYLFFRGHDLPGGGFSAAVTFSIALLLQYMASNVRWIEMRITILPIRWMGIGLLIAGASGIGAFLFGYPFLTAHARYVDIPFIGDVPMATAMIFDAGVVGAVVGSVVLMLIAIAHQSLRSARLREQEEAEPEEKEAR